MYIDVLGALGIYLIYSVAKINERGLNIFTMNTRECIHAMLAMVIHIYVYCYGCIGNLSNGEWPQPS